MLLEKIDCLIQRVSRRLLHLLVFITPDGEPMGRALVHHKLGNLMPFGEGFLSIPTSLGAEHVVRLSAAPQGGDDNGLDLSDREARWMGNGNSVNFQRMCA